MGQVTIFSGAARRRRWSDAQKFELVARAFAPGAVAAHVAREADVHTSQLFRWRSEFADKTIGDDETFAQMVVRPEEAGVSRRIAIQVRLERGQVDIADHASAALVTATLRALAR